jgi:hypothetical protein
MLDTNVRRNTAHLLLDILEPQTDFQGSGLRQHPDTFLLDAGRADVDPGTCAALHVTLIQSVSAALATVNVARSTHRGCWLMLSSRRVLQAASQLDNHRRSFDPVGFWPLSAALARCSGSGDTALLMASLMNRVHGHA